MLMQDDAVRRAINKTGTSSDEIKRIAVLACARVTLSQDAMGKVRYGPWPMEDALANGAVEDIEGAPVAASDASAGPLLAGKVAR